MEGFMSGDRSSPRFSDGLPEERSGATARDAERSRWAGKQVFTTGEAAEVCKVSQQTIIRCFDSGRLNGFRVPGSRFRRIPRAELIRFMRSNEIPLDALGDDRKRVLVVDDDPQVLALVQETLKDERFELRTAGNGYDAGILTEQFRPDLILLDFMLPDINGSVVCERIRGNAEYAGTRIIFISGVADEADVSKLLARGADAFIAKPFRADELLRVVNKLLEA
jgi:excisionase family DNA binding protein